MGGKETGIIGIVGNLSVNLAFWRLPIRVVNLIYVSYL